MVSITGWNASIVGLRSTMSTVSEVEGIKTSGVERVEEVAGDGSYGIHKTRAFRVNAFSSSFLRRRPLSIICTRAGQPPRL